MQTGFTRCFVLGINVSRVLDNLWRLALREADDYEPLRGVGLSDAENFVKKSTNSILCR